MGGKPREENAAPRPEAAQTWELLLDFGIRLRGHVTAVAAEFDLTPAQMFALKRLEPGSPLPMNALAEKLICDASTVTGLVDKLEGRGLIQRRPDERDRRVKMLVLTAKGERIRRQFLDRMKEPPPVIRAMPAEEQARLREQLLRVVEQWPADLD